MSVGFLSPTFYEMLASLADELGLSEVARKYKNIATSPEKTTSTQPVPVDIKLHVEGPTQQQK